MPDDLSEQEYRVDVRDDGLYLIHISDPDNEEYYINTTTTYASVRGVWKDFILVDTTLAELQINGRIVQINEFERTEDENELHNRAKQLVDEYYDLPMKRARWIKRNADARSSRVNRIASFVAVYLITRDA